MSTPEDTVPQDAAAPPSAADTTHVAPAEAAVDAAAPTAADSTAAPGDTLSPAVRRLVRQFDLDITGIHGTGPEGRIRVGDVMGLLGGRTDTGKRDAPLAGGFEPPDDGDSSIDGNAPAAALPAPAPPLPAADTAGTASAALTTTVFDCDLSRVLSHRKRLRGDNVEVLLTSYVLAALAEALAAVPEVAASGAARLGALLTTADGATRSALLDATHANTAVGERLLAIDAELRARLDTAVDGSGLLVHHYGDCGSLLATPTPTPLGAGHAASVGIGRVRREIVVRSTDGVETPRVAARCYVTLSFRADRVAFGRANAFLARAVRVLEQWPE